MFQTFSGTVQFNGATYCILVIGPPGMWKNDAESAVLATGGTLFSLDHPRTLPSFPLITPTPDDQNNYTVHFFPDPSFTLKWDEQYAKTIVLRKVDTFKFDVISTQTAAYTARTIRELFAQLESADPSVRRRALSTIASTKHPELLSPLLTLLGKTVQNRNFLSAEMIVWILEYYADPSTIGPLRHVFTSGTKPLCHYAFRALTRINDPRTEPFMIAALNDSDWIIRHRAAEALGTIGSERALQPLFDLLEREDKIPNHNSPVQDAAFDALKKATNRARDGQFQIPPKILTRIAARPKQIGNLALVP